MSRSRVMVAALVALVMGALAGVGTAGPASAHSGGKAVVLVRELTLTPMNGQWHATATLADFDDGTPINSSSLQLTPGAGAAPVTLKPTGAAGGYDGMLTGAKAGTIALSMDVRTIPGSTAVQPFHKTWPSVTLTADKATNVVAGGGGGGGSNLPLIISVAAVVLAGALLYGLFSVRRRTSVPAKSA